jgi:hypothetical protein
MESLRHRSAEPLSQYEALANIPTQKNQDSTGHKFNFGSSRTAGRGGVVLDGSTLAVELVVDDPRGLGLGGVEAALGDRASLLRGTLGEAGNVALSEHGGGCGWAAGGLLEGRGVEARRTLKSEPL